MGAEPWWQHLARASVSGTDTVRERCIPIADSAVWKDALRGVNHSFFHTWENCHAMHLTTEAPTYLYSFERRGKRVVCPFFERTYDGMIDIVTPYGFSGFAGDLPYEEFGVNWNALTSARSYVCGFLQLHPILQGEGWFPELELHEYNDVFVLDLTQSLDELYEALSTNRKRQLREWGRLEASLTHDRDEWAAFVISQYQQFYAVTNASDAYHFSPETFRVLIGLDDVLSVGFSTGSGLEAVSIFARGSSVGEFLFNISVPGGRRHSTALIWYGARALKAMGASVLNLGGGVQRNDALAEYKRRFGGEVRPLRALRQVYDPFAYRNLCLRAGVEPDDNTGYFPPYRRGEPQETRRI